MGRVYTIGEALIDFVPEERGSLKEAVHFEKKFGGAPANVAMIVSILGGDAAFIGKVGEDPFGEFLKKRMEEHNVDTSFVFFSKEAKTSLAFVSLDEEGDRDFIFYRNPGADMELRKEEIAEIEFEKEDFLCFGSFALAKAPLKEAVKKILENIKQAGGTVLFDPNIREDIWKNKEELKNTLQEFLVYADILKASEEEVLFLSGEKTVSEAVNVLKDKVSHLLVTLGKEGSLLIKGEKEIRRKGKEVNVVDTTGAGDAFVGAVLYQLQKKDRDLSLISLDEWENVLDYANKTAGLAATRKGAVEAVRDIRDE